METAQQPEYSSNLGSCAGVADVGVHSTSHKSLCKCVDERTKIILSVPSTSIPPTLFSLNKSKRMADKKREESLPLEFKLVSADEVPLTYAIEIQGNNSYKDVIN